MQSYLDNFQRSNNSILAPDTSMLYFKPSFLKHSNFTQRKMRMLAKK